MTFPDYLDIFSSDRVEKGDVLPSLVTDQPDMVLLFLLTFLEQTSGKFDVGHLHFHSRTTSF